VEVRVPSAPTDAIVKALLRLGDGNAYLDAEARRASLAAALRTERAARRAVAALKCDGKEFSDIYQDGLCFRARTATQKRNVATYYTARERLDRVPRYHLGQTFSVAVRVVGGEPTDGTCGQPCNDLLQRIVGLLANTLRKPIEREVGTLPPPLGCLRTSPTSPRRAASLAQPERACNAPVAPLSACLSSLAIILWPTPITP